MRKFLVQAAMLVVLVLYCAVVLWLALTGQAAKMLAGALLAAAPLIVAMHQSLREANLQRLRIEQAIDRLREDVKQLHQDHDAVLR